MEVHSHAEATCCVISCGGGRDCARKSTAEGPAKGPAKAAARGTVAVAVAVAVAVTVAVAVAVAVAVVVTATATARAAEGDEPRVAAPAGGAGACPKVGGVAGTLVSRMCVA